MFNVCALQLTITPFPHQLQPQADNSELTHLLEALVADGEALKRDNAELRNFLGEARTEIRTLSDEVLELRAGTIPVDLREFISIA